MRGRARSYTTVSVLVVAGIVIATILGAAASVSIAADKDSELAAERALLKATAEMRRDHVREIERLARWTVASGLDAETKELIATVRRIDPEYAGLARMEERLAAMAAVPPEKVADARKSYAKRLADVNEKNAKDLFGLAVNCMKFGLFTRAYDLVRQVIEADPDHKKARDVLSYALDRETKMWITKWEASMKRTHFLTEEGWVSKKDRKKWEMGLRPYLGKWVTIEEEEKIRLRNDYNPYSAETEHFEVKTNLGRKQAFEFALLLEDFYSAFFPFFIGYYDQEKGAKLLFNQAKLKRKHQVKVFPSHVEYLTFVKAEKGNEKLLRESAGFYSSGDRSSFFYWTEDRSSGLETLYHEVAHQLFDETKEGRGSSKGNNWVVEGIASYMETWEKVDGKWLPGHRIDDRLRTVKEFLAANPGWELAPYLAIDNRKFHEEGRGLNYALGSALSHFLLHGQDEIYREPYIRFISAFYEGKVVEDSLGKMIEVEGAASPAGAIATLEAQFKEYMKTLGEKPPVVAEDADVDADAVEAADGATDAADDS